jgi:hypothetical protein
VDSVSDGAHAINKSELWRSEELALNMDGDGCELE